MNAVLNPPAETCLGRNPFDDRSDFGTTQTSYRDCVPTGVAPIYYNGGLATTWPCQMSRPQEWIEEWNRILGDLWQSMHQDESATDDAEYELPSPLALSSAMRLVCHMASPTDPSPPPTRVFPDGEGGIVFEHRSPSSKELIEIDSEGNGELILMKNRKVIKRYALTLSAA